MSQHHLTPDKRVLVVDDDPIMVTLLTRYLSKEGFQVLSAANGLQALDILHREGPGIVLSDWAMPEMDGLQLCQAIRSSEAMGFVYVIMLTAHSDKQRVVQALEAGANDYLAKPFHRQELVARVNAGLRIIVLEADLMRERRELHRVNAELSILNRKLDIIATTDELTGLYNRREAMRQLGSCWATRQEDGGPMSCVMIDIDHFKGYNDRYGHDVGDAVLKSTAAALRHCACRGHELFRIGGEEFLAICSNSNAARATQLAELFRAAVEANQVEVAGHVLNLTISVGVAERDAAMTRPDDVLREADRAMYRAKQNGRNSVQVYGGPAGAAQATTVAAV